MVPCRDSAPPAIFHGMRKALSPDPGAPSPRERTDGLPVKAWDWESGALDAFPGYIRNLLCGTTYLCAHVSSSSFPLAHRFFQTFHLAARMWWVFFFFFFRRVLFTDSKASRHAVTSTWTRRPLLPRLLPPPRSSHQSLPSPYRAAAVQRLLQIQLVARTSPCSTFGALLWVLPQAVHSEARAIRMLRAEPAPGAEGGRQRAGFSPHSGNAAGRSVVISVDVTHSRAA